MSLRAVAAFGPRLLLLAVLPSTVASAQQRSTPVPAGFAATGWFGEFARTTVTDDSVRVQVNIAGDYDPSRRTEIIFFALPNGNTIEQTVGRRMADGVDWHFDIQHIGAQARVLRRDVRDRNVVLVYLEAPARSWPSWRARHPDNPARIVRLLENAFPEAPRATWTISGHSGGGSLAFGLLNNADRVPDRITRIIFLDSNYAYDESLHHGEKLLDWLRRNRRNHLVIAAYDDREITVDGKKVVSETGGTYRSTFRMLDYWKSRRLSIPEDTVGEFRRWRAIDGRLDVRIHPNPENEILHTVMVGEMNGFLHGMTIGTSKPRLLGRPRAYMEWVQ